MDETTEQLESNDDTAKILESPKPVAFTVDFGENKPIDSQRFKNLVEKYQNRHRRGQSLSKIEEPTTNNTNKKPLTGNLPRKSGYHVEGYHSSDEKNDRLKTPGAKSSVLNSVLRKAELTLPIKSCVSMDRMTQSYPSRSFNLPVIDSPEVEIKDISSPELEPMSPMSPLVNVKSPTMSNHANYKISLNNHQKTPTSGSSEDISIDRYESCIEFDKIEVASDTGTYTIDTDNYTEEQKQRMSIDKDFNIEQVSVITKTREYIQSLLMGRTKIDESPTSPSPPTPPQPRKPDPVDLSRNVIQTEVPCSPAMQTNDVLNNTIRKSKSVTKDLKKPKEIPEENVDRGVFTLVTTSGVLNKKSQYKGYNRQPSLVKSVVAVETYPTTMSTNNGAQIVHSAVYVPPPSNIEQRIEPLSPTEINRSINKGYIVQRNSKVESVEYMEQLPLNRSGGSSGKNSPSKIPSPLHTLKSRNRNSYCSPNDFYSDSSLETESYLKPTQNIISSLQQRLSLDSDSDDQHKKFNVPLNNEAKILLKCKPVHVRHNSFDDKNINKLPNKLQHFHNKNLQGIDQTFKSCNQYSQNRTVHQIQNSPNNSPIRRSSSFSLKNQFDNQPKCLNTYLNRDSIYRRTTPQTAIQRSSSTANIKPKAENLRRASINSDSHVTTDRSSYIETESSSEEDLDRTIVKNKKDLTTTRYNRAFALRRGRLEEPPPPVPRCPNTPEMRRKFRSSEKEGRPASVDRKSANKQEVQSRYMLNITKQPPKSAPPKTEASKPPQKLPMTKPPLIKQIFSRTDSGRYSLRSPKPSSAPIMKMNTRREPPGKKSSGTRSNSTLSSREVEFQNWKRRKSYDPMKAAAEGKRKAELARKQNIMTQSYNETSQEYDSSPSHSSSVHRSQSFHGTAALEQNLISSEDDLTFSGDEGFSPPTPSPCELSPSKSNLRHNLWREKFMSKH